MPLFSLGLMVENDSLTSSYKYVFERYEQRCEAKTRVTYHSILALKPVVRDSTIEHTSTIEIIDSGVELPISITKDGDLYYYDNLFGKNRHYESWRTICSDAKCMTNVNYYRNEYVTTEGRFELRLNFRNQQGKVLETVDFVHLEDNNLLPEEQPYPVFDTSINEQDFTISLTESDSRPYHLVFQLEDMSGRRELKHDNVQPGQTLSHPIPDSTLLYAGVFAYASDEDKNTGYENKVEHFNVNDVFYEECADRFLNRE